MMLTLTRQKIALLAVVFLFVGVGVRAEESESMLPTGKWKLVFQDEFAGTNKAIDKTWEFQNGPSGHILCSRWRENAVVSNGVLTLKAKKEKRGGQEWTAASMWTKQKFKYGYFECRYKYAKAKGTNNSFWLMTRDIPKDAAGRFEIDINEGHYPDRINMNIHNWSGEHWAKSKHMTVDGANLADAFHTYGLEWNKDELIWYFDGKEIRREKNTICHGESPVWLSLAIIKWAGPVTDAIDGTSMDVDYVRVYQRDESGPNKPDSGDGK
jgi:beta-glucanase (GH16 family)